MNRRVHQLWSWIKWGCLRQRVTDRLDGHLVMEYEVISCRTGKVIGYWAHGYFDPYMPYVGQPALWMAA